MQISFTSADQETNDLTKSVHFCAYKTDEEIAIVGGTGYREDHTLGNISLLADYMEAATVMMVTNYGIFHQCVVWLNFQVTPDNRSHSFR